MSMHHPLDLSLLWDFSNKMFLDIFCHKSGTYAELPTRFIRNNFDYYYITILAIELIGSYNQQHIL